LRIGGDILKVTIRTSDPEVKLVFLSAYVNDQCIDQALELEAQGYLSKQDPVEVVFDAVRGAYHGGPPIRNQCATVSSSTPVESGRLRAAAAACNC